MLFEQSLIQARVPFDIVFDENLRDLSKYRVLALADQECLSDEQLGLIRNFVDRGGGLVATGDTALYNQWRQRRRESGLKDVKAVYIRTVQPAVPKPPAAAATSAYWKLPLNWEELIAAVRRAAGGSLSLDVKAPPAVTAEVYEQRDKRRLLVHLVNYAAAGAGNVPVDVALPAGAAVEKVTLLSPDLSPDEAASRPLVAAVKSGRAAFTVPGLKTYSLAVLQLK
jgi:hypothetical protein